MVMTKMLLLLLGVAVPTTLAAPQPLPKTAFDAIINVFLDENIPDEPITNEGPLTLDANQPGVMEILLNMYDVSITGVGDFISDGSTTTITTGDDSIYIYIHSPQVTLNTASYTLEGTIVDHIDLYGAGSGWIRVDEMVVILEGKGNVTDEYAVFSSATIDLEMWRWTVNLEGIMPGTDLGTVFNEFFTMCGPEIFDTIENNINKSDKVLNFLNSLKPPPPAIKGPEA